MSAAPPAARQDYLPYFDGLRGIAVLAVLLYHLDAPFLRGGFVGVDIFFVISGFLITRIILGDIQSGAFTLPRFYASRIRRIFPALFVMLTLGSLAAIVFLGRAEYSEYFKALRYAAMQASNIFFNRDVDYFAIDDAPSPLLHTWTLGVEAQFYLIWPIILMLVYKRFGPKITTFVTTGIVLTSIIGAEILLHTNARAAFYLLPTRGWEIALGALAACIPWQITLYSRYREIIAAAGLALILAATVFSSPAQFPGLSALIPCGGAFLVIWAAQNGDSLIRRALSFRPLMLLGLISYSLYLWHWPVIAFYKSYFGPTLSLSTGALLACLSLGFAAASYVYVERPCRRSRLAPWKIIAIGLGTMAVLIGASNILKKGKEAPWRLTDRMDAAVAEPNPYYDLCAHEGGAYDTKNCIIGPNPDRYEIILSGDSHAAHYIPMVLDWAKTEGLTTRIFLRGDCKTWVETTAPKMHQGKLDPYCTQLTQDFYNIIQTTPHLKHIFLALMIPGDSEDNRRALERLKASGKAVYYLGAAPIFAEDPHECRVKDALLIGKIFPRPHHDCLAFDKVYMASHLAQTLGGFRARLEKMDIPYFDPLPAMTSPIDENEQFMFMDDHHLNIFGARHLVPAFTDFMKEYITPIPTGPRVN